ncbi:helix-turn-helix domain-containing protein [Streptomyces boncukensis]|uniref:Helix-turn-helix transcriptional regulator n=1 Tax=Streptomyces boncukensis TaxID=2711219 RepID=A0A6G4WYD4_9ACTN|nr:helix-turn-helix transcriptional regulator [Streptomyces boncukensis]NGO70013.1 helix-turn-helix transcriptional regulator [Streptomyces boncukensis]
MTARRTAAGTITGFVLRLARESIPLTQTAAAEALGVDLATVQGWESGRRPVANMRAGAFLDLRRRLLALKADHVVLSLLDAALDADRIVGAALDPPDAADLHPLAGWVHTRSTAHLLSWALNGIRPPALGSLTTPHRRGPVAAAPLLAVSERATFFDQLRTSVEAAGTSETLALLRRQALYLCAYDRSPEGASWTAHTLQARRDVLSLRGWTPHWAEARSTATALVRQGDLQPLLDFIDRAMTDDDRAEAANLTYWAYWLGVLPGAQPDDGFMCRRTDWDPVALLRSLVEGLDQAPGYVDLYAHTIWALLTAHPWLPQAVPALADRLDGQAVRFLDEGRLSPRTSSELSTVHYVLRDQH